MFNIFCWFLIGWTKQENVLLFIDRITHQLIEKIIVRLTDNEPKHSLQL